MALFPININIENKKCVVVGGGKVACRKAKALIDFGASVTIIAKELKAEFTTKNIVLKEFDFSDIENAFLVVAATDNKNLNSKIADYCKKNNIYINSATNIDECSFTFSSYIKDEDVVIAVSTSGKVPALAKYIKKSILENLPSNLGKKLDNISNMRKNIYEQYGDKGKEILKELIKKEFENNSNGLSGDINDNKNRD